MPYASHSSSFQPGAETELQAAVGDDVDGGGHIGQHRWMAVHDAGDQHPDAQTSSRLRQRGERHPAVKARSGRVAEDRIEVIERPA